eukprot:jgi/Mesvir1/508/Mv11372-RA.1
MAHRWVGACVFCNTLPDVSCRSPNYTVAENKLPWHARWQGMGRHTYSVRSLLLGCKARSPCLRVSARQRRIKDRFSQYKFVACASSVQAAIEEGPVPERGVEESKREIVVSEQGTTNKKSVQYSLQDVVPPRNRYRPCSTCTEDALVVDGPELEESRTIQEDVVEFCCAYENGQQSGDIVSLDFVGTWGQGKARPDRFLWMALSNPTESIMRDLGNVFHLHELLVEETLNEGVQRPRFEVFDASTRLITLRAAMFSVALDRVQFANVDIILGDDFIITISHHRDLTFTYCQARMERLSQLLMLGPECVLISIMAEVIGGYNDILVHLSSDIEEVNQSIFSAVGPTRDDIKRLYLLRSDVLSMRRAVSPLLEICARLEEEAEFSAAELRPYLRNVSINSSQLKEDLEATTEMLHHAFDAGAMVREMEESIVQKKLAAWGAILLVPTILAGVYGMNFEHMPELQWEYSYYFWWVSAITVCSTLYWQFRRSGWI